jgi:hypothetical protein
MITKINAHKIKHQPNIEIFVWDCDNLVKKNQNKLYQKGLHWKKRKLEDGIFFKKNSHCY